MGILIFSGIVLLTLLLTALVIFVVLAQWPGKTAAARQHPYVEAVTVAGWVGLLAGGVLWPLALVWAYLTPPVTAEGEEQ